MQLSSIPELPQEFVRNLEDCGLKTDIEFLSTSTVEILRSMPTGSTTRAEIGKYKEVVAKATSAAGFTARDLLQPTSGKVPYETILPLPSSLAALSHVLLPRSGRVIELSGQRDSKRSEFILNIVLRYLAKNAHGTVHWVDTTGDFSPNTASAIASHYSENGGLTCLERIHLSLALEVEHLFDILDGVTSPLAADNNTKLSYLVIDNINSLLAPLLSGVSSQGHVLMANLMHQIKNFSQSHLITVIVVNNGIGLRRDSREANKRPALGPTFTFLTDTTLWIAVEGSYRPALDTDSRNEEDRNILCRLELLKSNFTVSN